MIITGHGNAKSKRGAAFGPFPSGRGGARPLMMTAENFNLWEVHEMRYVNNTRGALPVPLWFQLVRVVVVGGLLALAAAA